MNHIHKILDFIIKNKIKFIAGFAVVIVLTVAFATGGSLNSTSMPVAATSDSALQNINKKTDSVFSTEASETPISLASTTAPTVTEEETKNDNTNTKANSQATTKNVNDNVALIVQNNLKDNVVNDLTSQGKPTGTNNNQTKATTPTLDKYQTESIPQGKPEPIEPEEQETKDTTLTCTISISCSTILDNMSKLDPAKKDLVPSDGWILKPTKVTFNEGESVFDVLKKVCKDNLIHFEFSWTPIYNSAYIEGINNLYEFDCGSTSGWMYCVDNWYPNYGCSRYVIKNGDTIDWKYTCNLGYDINGGYAAGEKQQ